MCKVTAAARLGVDAPSGKDRHGRGCSQRRRMARWKRKRLGHRPNPWGGWRLGEAQNSPEGLSRSITTSHPSGLPPQRNDRRNTHARDWQPRSARRGYSPANPQAPRARPVRLWQMSVGQPDGPTLFLLSWHLAFDRMAWLISFSRWRTG